MSAQKPPFLSQKIIKIAILIIGLGLLIYGVLYAYALGTGAYFMFI